MSDGQADSALASVSVTVEYGDHPPTADPQQVSAAPGMPQTVTLCGTDPHGDPRTFAVAMAPAHGTLASTPPSVTYTSAAGYSGTDSFTFTASDYGATSPPATVSITVGGSVAWAPPIGIPAPSFGINESHTMYAGQQWNYGSGLEPYRNAGNGPYTHCIDNSSAASTDANNTYGSPSKPRKTIPTDLPPGSVVEVHGGPYSFTSGGRTVLGGSGTASKPIFIRGYSAASKPVFTASAEVLGTYVIVENLDFNSVDGVYAIRPNHHLAIRHCEKRGGVGTYRAAMAVAGDPGIFIHDVVFYDNKIHDNGDWQGAGDQDYHGFHVSESVYNVWFVDNEMYHNSGDGLQINAGSAQKVLTTHHIYVGRNVSHHNKQGGMWCKQASDVILSQNTIYRHRPSDSSCGGGTGYQYGPERVWFLYNHIYDCEIGIGLGSASGAGGDGPGTDAYFVGNVIHHITQSVTSPTGPWKWGCALQVTDEYARKHIVNNTIYDCDSGIMNPRGVGGLDIVNNIFGTVRQEQVWIATDAAAMASTLHHSLFGGGARLYWGDTPLHNVASFRAAFPAQGAGCAEAEPQFMNAAGGDFHLRSTSPGVNGGAADNVYTTFYLLYGLNISVDFDGVARPQGGTIDMGAFEQ